jgi:protein-S-isoprenylcysteine O-methyltransferase Ste14
MLDFIIVGPVVGAFAVIDVSLHLYLDLKKVRANANAAYREPRLHISSFAMAAVVFSTLLAFLLVLILSVAWLIPGGTDVVNFIYLFYYDLPAMIWGPGFLLLLLGIALHSWARLERKEMASSWAMKETQRLIVSGPYSRIRHPSYSSYILCFIGLFLMLPSVVTCLTFFGIWGYHATAITEEASLLDHFGAAYGEYMKRAGRFIPKFR